MDALQYSRALIVGARLFAREGLGVGLAVRQTDKLADLSRGTGARTFACDATEPMT